MKRLHLIAKRFDALTLFEWILTGKKEGEFRQELIYHEERHVWQYRWHGYVLFLPMYLLLSLFFGYENHPYERDAQRYAARRIKKDS